MNQSRFSRNRSNNACPRILSQLPHQQTLCSLLLEDLQWLCHCQSQPSLASVFQSESRRSSHVLPTIPHPRPSTWRVSRYRGGTVLAPVNDAMALCYSRRRSAVPPTYHFRRQGRNAHRTMMPLHHTMTLQNQFHRSHHLVRNWNLRHHPLHTR